MTIFQFFFKNILASFMIAIFFFNTNAGAQSFIRVENPICRLDVEHLSGKIKFEGKETRVISNRPAKFRLKRGTAIEIWITDNNPLIFSYNNEIVTEDSQDYSVFKKLIPALGKALTGMGIEGYSLPLSENALSENTGFQKLNSENEKLRANILNNLGNIIVGIESYTKKRSKIIDMTTRSSNDVDRAKSIVNNWKLNELSKQLSDSYSKLKGTYDPKTALKYEDYSALDKEDELEEILSGLNKFVSLVNQVHTGIKLENTVETNDTRKQYQLTISVKPNIAFNKLLSKEAINAQHKGEKDIQLYFERESYVRYALSAGAVYSFVKAPKFSVKEDSEGNRTISKSSDDYKKFSGAIMLNIIPERLFESNFEPFIQIGASANGDSLGLLLGTGFSIFSFPSDKGDIQRSLTVSGGVIWQKIEKLADGLSVGDRITTDSELKTEEKFDSGLYLMLGVNF